MLLTLLKFAEPWSNKLFKQSTEQTPANLPQGITTTRSMTVAAVVLKTTWDSIVADVTTSAT